MCYDLVMPLLTRIMCWCALLGKRYVRARALSLLFKFCCAGKEPRACPILDKQSTLVISPLWASHQRHMDYLGYLYFSLPSHRAQLSVYPQIHNADAQLETPRQSLIPLFGWC